MYARKSMSGCDPQTAQMADISSAEEILPELRKSSNYHLLKYAVEVQVTRLRDTECVNYA